MRASIGSALVWIPAAIIFIAQGVVTSVVALIIFFSTLGGIMMLGIAGIFIGPLIASLFVTIRELYGIEFSDYLPEVC